jgi:hypothetical protein
VWIAVRLVRRKDLVPPPRPGGVRGRHEEARIALGEQPHEHRGEAVDHVRRRAVAAARRRRHGVPGLVRPEEQVDHVRRARPAHAAPEPGEARRIPSRRRAARICFFQALMVGPM